MQLQTLPGFQSFVELKDYIHTTLCHREQLDTEAFPMKEQILKRGDKRIGFLFSILGPRSVSFNAIFETERNTIHFYNSAGERVLSNLLQNPPPMVA